GALSAGLRALSGGKGVTEDEARASALGEAVERYSATRQGDEAVVVDTLRGLGEQAVHPNECLLFHDRQFADRARWNARHWHFQHVTERFEENAPIEWTPVWSPATGRHRMVPTGLLYYGRCGAGGDRDWVRADSNGNAAGSSVEDAVLQGFLELVERDAVALW